MLLQFTDQTQFASGAASFYNPPGSDDLSKARITVAVEIGGLITTAIVDTGQLYMVLSPELADVIPLGRVEDVGPTELPIEGELVSGRLHRVDLTLFNADADGDDLPLEVLAFVPDSKEPRPSFLGLTSCLDAIRFAVDANSERFYFG
jgi:hypothetical protein